MERSSDGRFLPDPESRTRRVLRWYAEHPGYHRCVDVAASMGERTHPVAVISRHLYTTGELKRRHMSEPGRKTEVTYYAADAKAQAHTKEPQPA